LYALNWKILFKARFIMNIAIYARKSVFSDKSDSVESQIKICKDYIQNNNLKAITIVEYEDEGYTGANTNRPGFTQLMNDIMKKKINMLICYKIDRISRNVSDFSKIFDTLQQHNVQFVSVKEQIDTSTPLGRAMMYICSVFAQMERETTAERVKDNMIELAKSGKWAGGKPPIGFKRERVLLNGKYHTILIENKDEIPFLNMIYDTFLQGYSLSGLETYFRQKGIKSLNGCYLSASQIHGILKNPHYVAATTEIYDYFEKLGCIMAVDKEKFDGKHGIIAYGRTKGGKGKVIHKLNSSENWIISVGLHKPLISAEKWLAVQERFGKNKINKTRKYEIGILKGILKCKCGYTMRVQHKVDKIYNKVYDNYFCQKRNRMGPEYCDMSAVKVNELDNKIIEVLRQLSIDKNLLEKYIKQTNDPILINNIRDKNTIKKDIEKIKKKIENLAITLQDNSESIAAKYIIAEIEKLDKQMAGLNYELREVEFKEQENNKRKENINIIHEKICNYLDKFDTLPYNDKVKYLQDIIKECIWDGKNLIITF